MLRASQSLTVRQILYHPPMLAFKHMPLKEDSNSITTLKQQLGAKPCGQDSPNQIALLFLSPELSVLTEYRITFVIKRGQKPCKC